MKILEPKQTFAFRTEGRLLTYTSTRTFSEIDGGTELSETLDIEPAKGIYVLMHPIVSRMATSMHQNSPNNLKRILES